MAAEQRMMAAPVDEGRAARQRLRSLAIALALGALAILFYAVTIVRLGPNAIRRDEFAPPVPVVNEAPVDPSQSECKRAGTC
jgi:hypothetical protein